MFLPPQPTSVAHTQSCSSLPSPPVSPTHSHVPPSPAHQCGPHTVMFLPPQPTSESHTQSYSSFPSCLFGPRYEGQLTRMAEPIPPSGQSSSYSLTTLSSSSSTDRRAETDKMVITTQIAVVHHFICRLRRRESCILGATSSQPTLPLHELPPARLVIHRQTSNHERRKGTLSVQSRSGILADFCPRQH